MLVIFLSAVTSYFVVLPPDLVKRTNTVALDFGSAIFGTTGGIIFAFLVAFSCFGALNGQVYTTARLISAASREGYLPTLFGDVNRWTRTPLAALLLQVVLIILFIVFGSGFASLVNFYGVCSWTFYLATVLGLLVLRIKEPNLTRPYKVSFRFDTSRCWSPFLIQSPFIPLTTQRPGFRPRSSLLVSLTFKGEVHEQQD